MTNIKTDIVERLMAAESSVDGEARAAIHDAWREILWLREGIALAAIMVERIQQRTESAP